MECPRLGRTPGVVSLSIPPTVRRLLGVEEPVEVPEAQGAPEDDAETLAGPLAPV
jgi:hypothetical protein